MSNSVSVIHKDTVWATIPAAVPVVCRLLPKALQSVSPTAAGSGPASTAGKVAAGADQDGVR